MKGDWLTSLEELSSLEREWEGLRSESGGSIFTSYPVDALWYESYRDAAPRVLVLHDEGKLVGLVPMTYYLTQEGKAELGVLAFVGGWRGKLRFSHLGPLLKPGVQGIIERMVKEVRGAEWQVVRMRFMAQSASTSELVSGMRDVCMEEEYAPTPSVTCLIPAAGDVTSFFGPKTRDTMSYKMRRLEKAGRLEFRSVPEDEVPRSMDFHVRQHIERWKDRGGSFFSNPQNAGFLRALTSMAVRKGFGFMNELLIDGEVAAQDIGLFDFHMVRIYRGGMNDELSHHSPGTLLFIKEMEWLRERGFSAINLGRGDEPYKMHMGGKVDYLVSFQGRRGMPALKARLMRSYPKKALDTLKARAVLAKGDGS